MVTLQTVNKVIRSHMISVCVSSYLVVLGYNFSTDFAHNNNKGMGMQASNVGRQILFLTTKGQLCLKSFDIQ